MKKLIKKYPNLFTFIVLVTLPVWGLLLPIFLVLRNIFQGIRRNIVLWEK